MSYIIVWVKGDKYDTYKIANSDFVSGVGISTLIWEIFVQCIINIATK